MSRSRKKNPVISVCKNRTGALRKDKKQANVEIRKTGLEDMPDGRYYRRVNERWSWIDDGKTWGMRDDPKSYRK